jgi:hypothetical protein
MAKEVSPEVPEVSEVAAEVSAELPSDAVYLTTVLYDVVYYFKARGAQSWVKDAASATILTDKARANKFMFRAKAANPLHTFTFVPATVIRGRDLALPL